MVKMELLNGVGESEGITLDSVKTFLNAHKNEDVQFDIATLGGDLSTALTIFDLIKTHPKKTIANIIGLTASAGTVIALACDEVKMSDNALFLIHNGWKEVTGNIYDMKQAVSMLSKTDAIMVKIYREKTGLSTDIIERLMKASDWLSSSEAESYGFVDSVYSTSSKIAASAIISGAKGKINNLLITKLEQKMKNPFKTQAQKADVIEVLALKDGRNLLINAAKPDKGVDVMPCGATGTLEDGTFELTDGRVITVTGGTITNIETPSEPAGAEVDAEAIVEAVSALIAPVMAEVEEMKKTLASIKSTYKPAKNTMPVAQAKSTETVDALQAKIEAKTAELKAAADAKRKGA